MREIIGAQGEITIIKVDSLPTVETKLVELIDKGFIISHSENGNHHLLTGGSVMERLEVPEGMKILYAILEEPQQLIQDAPVPHGGFSLPAGFYEFRISREFDPFAQQARQVAD